MKNFEPGTTEWTRAHNSYLNPPEYDEIPEEYYDWDTVEPEVGMEVMTSFPKDHRHYDKNDLTGTIQYMNETVVTVRWEDSSTIAVLSRPDLFAYVTPSDDVAMERWEADIEYQ